MQFVGYGFNSHLPALNIIQGIHIGVFIDVDKRRRRQRRDGWCTCRTLGLIQSCKGSGRRTPQGECIASEERGVAFEVEAVRPGNINRNTVIVHGLDGLKIITIDIGNNNTSEVLGLVYFSKQAPQKLEEDVGAF